MKKNIFNNQKHSVLKEMPISFRFRFLAFLSLFLFYHGPMANAQNNFTGILWVTPIVPEAFPANGNQTWNHGLNMAFGDYHVSEYHFLDSLHVNGSVNKIPIYEIEIEENYAHLEFELRQVLGYCYPSFFNMVGQPYSNSSEYQPFNYGMIMLDYIPDFIDSSVQPCSSTRSCNEELNTILNHYNILSYEYDPFVSAGGDTMARTIMITCIYSDILDLYYDLLPLNHLIEYISVDCRTGLPDMTYDCGPYSGYESNELPSISVTPNPVQDYVNISGVHVQSITLYDGLGRIVFSSIGHTNRIDMSYLPKNFYFLHVISDNGTVYLEKLIKQ